MESTIAFCLEANAGSVRRSGGLQELIDLHNERLDLPTEEWSKQVIADAAQRAGAAPDRQGV
ncbi:MAG: hypothetical protein FI737_00715 [SAR202 cluster bacterium]|nr:hypothetical protein [Dehalococcoidia bacterium]MQF87600.1 hypothetical protein [SAR202 cluster bacterium]